MKCSINLIILFFTFSLKCNLYSQSLTGIVNYKYVNSYGKEDNIKMSFDRYRSVSSSNRGNKTTREILGNGEVLDRMDEKKAMKQLESSSSTNSYSITKYYIDEEGDMVYKNLKEDSMIVRDVNHFDPVLFHESPMPKMNWTIINEFKKIGTFNCQKAQINFRGRKYIAWFTNLIPVSHGPWKFYGLPGLILEVSDEENLFQCLFVSIEVPLKDTTSLSIKPITGKRVHFKDYYDFLQKSEEEEVRVKLSKASARGVSISITPATIFKQELKYD
jgi:GLPGLI family protein